MAAPDPTTDGDLPPAMGRPALGALRAAGIRSLDEAAGWSDADLLRLHGLGPKALRVLRDALAARGAPPR
ncbi:hypothetical protein GC722_03760 [Auraticoccus sp. F435]|uniref:DNA-binding protein n=1 Tax=Auraticoccus cholistanensis TaxID=2656650 RepID=A0A6A9URF2_9ACTN|nr:hypothetical protein [Auraticoccus cholistanensis]MVA75148.1 hypothetical protein [Auraticoccus cholistanensis]